ncbi:hypothetical protein [uncultured Brachyspira sp.]|uniref:hypothetical protein n=1 Tax=uncultured Brachyspira sp. TaxID=221953 RepID=UPI0025FAE0C1|nr:hypothetical protein [uncultured Brachyspira sp.]
MILIKTKDDLYNFNNLIDICIIDNQINIINMASKIDILYENENKEVVQRVYNIIQKQIIDLNTKEVGDYIDVDAIVKEIEENYISIDRIFYN